MYMNLQKYSAGGHFKLVSDTYEGKFISAKKTFRMGYKYVNDKKNYKFNKIRYECLFRLVFKNSNAPLNFNFVAIVFL